MMARFGKVTGGLVTGGDPIEIEAYVGYDRNPTDLHLCSSRRERARERERLALCLVLVSPGYI
jgi:hypothetical protein